MKTPPPRPTMQSDAAREVMAKRPTTPVTTGIPNRLEVSVSPTVPDTSDTSDTSDGFPGGSALPVKLADLLAESADWFRRFIRTRLECGPELLALWTAHTHLIKASWSSPRVIVTSAIAACGKTTVLDHLERLTPNPMMGSQATPALIARVVSARQTTVLLDETDNLLSNKKDGTPDLLATLNSGYRRGGSRPVLVPKKGGDWEAKNMSTFAAVALAGIGDHLPDAVVSRSITLRLDRATNGEIEPSNWRRLEPEAHALRDRLAQWCESHESELAESLDHLKLPSELHGRDLEVWEPLLAIGAFAGNGWHEIAEECRRRFSEERDLDALNGQGERQGLRLLKAIRDVWTDGSEFIATRQLIECLAASDPDQWGPSAPFGTLKPKRLAILLNEFGIRPAQSQNRQLRGYYRNELAIVWRRYLNTYPPGRPSEASEASEPSGGRNE